VQGGRLQLVQEGESRGKPARRGHKFPFLSQMEVLFHQKTKAEQTLHREQTMTSTAATAEIIFNLGKENKQLAQLA
jgi:hypothetical protein